MLQQGHNWPEAVAQETIHLMTLNKALKHNDMFLTDMFGMLIAYSQMKFEMFTPSVSAPDQI